MYGLGATTGNDLTSTLANNVDAARAYLRDRWSDFLELGPRIVDLQHRAALAAQRAGEAGDMDRKRQAQQVIAALGRLNIKHGEAIDRYELERVGEALGFSGYHEPGGLGAVPVVPVAAFTGLALVVAWAFRAYEAEERKLDLIEAGVLTPAEAAALDAGPAPGTLFDGLEDVGRLVLYGVVAFVALQALQTFRPRANPPLHVWHTNPPADVFGEEVYDVRYRHALDGLDYVHDFGPDVELAGLPDGTVLLSHRDGLPLWEDFDVE